MVLTPQLCLCDVHYNRSPTTPTNSDKSPTRPNSKGDKFAARFEVVEAGAEEVVETAPLPVGAGVVTSVVAVVEALSVVGVAVLDSVGAAELEALEVDADAVLLAAVVVAEGVAEGLRVIISCAS